MKLSTKETVEWIKEVLKRPHIQDENTDYFRHKAAANAFLDKLPELENTLSRGGIIQDSHGNLCKDGDRISTKRNKGEELSATLEWDSNFKRFNFRWDSTRGSTASSSVVFLPHSEPLGGRLFEKIYKEENK